MVFGAYISGLILLLLEGLGKFVGLPSVSGISDGNLLFEHPVQFVRAYKLIGNNNFSVLFDRNAILGLKDIVLMHILLCEAPLGPFLGRHHLAVPQE